MMKERIMTVKEETGKGNRRFFAIVALGKARWYWVVWPSLRELQTTQTHLSHVAEGYEKTKAEAVEKALEAAGIDAEWIAAKYAKAYHHNSKAGTTLKGQPPRKTQSPTALGMQEFLYRDAWDPATKQWNTMPHRVVRRTSKFIYVEQQPYSPAELSGGWQESEPPTFRLDHQSLEQDGYAFIPAAATLADNEEPLFFSYDRKNQHPDQLPTCLRVLSLSWPCTIAEVQEAYRKLVKGAHPDAGGNPEKFLELQAAYEQALRLCR
jgi:hypothetical protein